MIKSTIVILIMAICLPIFGSKIRPLDYSTLNDKSTIILIGEVKELKEGEKVGGTYTRYHLKIARISCIKGKMDEKEFSISIRIGGVKGFDAMLKKDGKYVFFLNSTETKGIHQLAYPKAVAEFK